MSIRRKLLLLLLAVALLPLVVVRWHGRWTTRRLGEQLSEQARESLTRAAGTRLRRLAVSYGEIFRSQSDAIELALRFQAREFEHRLASRDVPGLAKPPLLASAFDAAPPPDAVVLPDRYFRLDDAGARVPLPGTPPRAAR